MNLDRLRSCWRAILGRSEVSERSVARCSGLPLHQVRDLVLPRKDTDQEHEIAERVQRLAQALPEDERSGLLRLVAKARAGELAVVIDRLENRVAELEALKDDDPSDHTPMTRRWC